MPVSQKYMSLVDNWTEIPGLTEVFVDWDQTVDKFWPLMAISFPIFVVLGFQMRYSII